MKALIFMSEEMKNPRPSREPLIVIQPADARFKMSRVNRVKINGECVLHSSGKPTPQIKTHSVRAWIECEWEDLEVLG